MRLGESEEFSVDPSQTVAFTDQDTLFLFSDGLIDLNDAEGNELGKRRLKKALESLLQENCTILHMREKIRELSRNHNSEELPEDDITFAFVRLKP